jgi:hypothetical protein
MTKEQLKAMCYTPAGDVRPKADVRAEMINTLILDELMDIDEAEDLIDKSLREFNLWGEPRLEDLIQAWEEDENASTGSA